MKIHFWGVRGSIPAPLHPSQIKSKISAVLERLTPDDIASEENREKFLAGLPPWIFGTVGGNTTTVSVSLGDPKSLLIFDCGSGLRELGMAQIKKKIKPKNYQIFLSHFHWDHLQGLPFFAPGYDKSVKLKFYSPKPDLEEIICNQMMPPYFPVHMDSMVSEKEFCILSEIVDFPEAKITWKKMNHPGDSYSYKVDDGKHKFIFATDTELTSEDFARKEENAAYFQGADLLVIDTQYTLGEAIEKYNWGHSAFSLAVDFSANWGIKHLVLFHHDPAYDDRKLYNILQSARWYMERVNIKGIKITLAVEGLEISL
ncbi:MAG: MBL fold metallo-hydrolase [Treponema sp.]|nr:MBL fold metallo-hydrolase [Treponema sp.]